MSQRGRPPQGPKLVESLEGSAEAKRRLQLMLETVTGSRTVAEVCQELGVCESRFHEMRKEILQAAASAAEPRPIGRPATPPPVEVELENLRLHRENQELKMQLEGAHIREELALVMPGVLKPRRGAKKGGLSSPDSKSARPGASPGTPPSSGASGSRTT
jgi:transposase-like protein